MENGSRCFLLSGPVKISTVEQTKFLAKLGQDKFIFRQVSGKTSRNCLFGSRAKLEIISQDGLGKRSSPRIGWWVGWIQSNGQICAFALTMDVREASDANKRMELGKAILTTLRFFKKEIIMTSKLKPNKDRGKLVGSTGPYRS